MRLEIRVRFAWKRRKGVGITAAAIDLLATTMSFTGQSWRTHLQQQFHIFQIQIFTSKVNLLAQPKALSIPIGAITPEPFEKHSLMSRHIAVHLPRLQRPQELHLDQFLVGELEQPIQESLQIMVSRLFLVRSKNASKFQRDFISLLRSKKNSIQLRIKLQIMAL